MRNKLQRLFQDAVERNFSFLTAFGHFQGPIPISEAYLISGLWYIGENLAVGLLLDEKDQGVYCEVRRVIEGRPVPYEYMGPQGQRTREYLLSLLSEQGVPEENLKIALRKKSSFEDSIPRLVRHYAQLLGKYGQVILADDRQALEKLQK